MKIYSENEHYKLYQGNMLDMLEVIEPNSIDSIVTDPPYELNFMNKGWDNSGIAFQPNTWKQCYEVLKPGGYLLAFGGSRTFHRIACAIEDAGFEIRDTIMWLYGSGFPKSMDISKQIDKHLGVERQIIGTKNYSSPDFTKYNGSMMNLSNLKEEKQRTQLYETAPATDLAKQWQGWGTALKPSFEPIIVARKPFKGSLVDNVIEYGVGGINIDECRVEPTNEVLSRKINSSNNEIYGKYNNFGNENNISDKLGRFPANTILTYDETDFDEVCGGMPDTFGSFRVGIRDSKNCMFDFGRNKDPLRGYTDSGSASRYFYCAKASKKDRDEGLDIEDSVITDGRKKPIDNAFNRGETLRKNTHPTVKPTELMQYLVRLITPNNGTILDPFNGSGSTGKAVMYENKERNKNYKYIGIELTEEYLPISKARIEYVCKDNDSIESLKENTEEVIEGQTNIFDFIGDD